VPLTQSSDITTDRATLAKLILAGEKPGQSYRVDPSDGIDMVEIGILAVLNNPDLKTQRAAAHVAAAQVFAAGLLPDPQISVSTDKPTGNTTGLVGAWNTGLAYDINALLTRASQVNASRKHAKQVNLNLLWQEWQVVLQARTLFVRLQLQAARRSLMEETYKLYKKRYDRSSSALAEGNVTLEVNGTDLTVLVDALSQMKKLEVDQTQTRHDLNVLLGFNTNEPIALVAMPKLTTIPERTFTERLQNLPELRPDLLALKAGYESQEANVRAAILAQFPSLSISLSRASDTSDVKTTGIGLNFNLPLFNRNRGNIDIARATRQLLGNEYRARLISTQIEVQRIRSVQAILRSQQLSLNTYLPQLKLLVNRSLLAYQRGDINALTYLNMESTWVNKKLEQLTLTQTEWENQLSLQALLALPEFFQSGS